MRLGFNYPWSLNRYGADIGPNPHVDLKQWQAEEALAKQNQLAAIPLPPLFVQLDRNLHNLRAMEISIVRFFLIGNGFNYVGFGPTWRGRASPNPSLPYYDWAFSPPLGTDPRFAFHFNELLVRFKKAHMQMIPSFIDFGFAGNSRPRDPKGLAPAGRADCISNPNARSIFLQTLLNDLLMTSAKPQHKDVIVAWEVMNEPYWNCSPFGPLTPNPPTNPRGEGPPPLGGLARYPEVDDKQMNDFLGEAVQAIRAHGFASTVGHRFFRDIYDEQSQTARFVTGTMPQFHYYAKHAFGFGDPPQIRDTPLFTPHPVKSNGSAASQTQPRPFLGEFDSDLNRYGKPWPDLKADTTLERLKLLAASGCELAVIWPDLGGDSFPDEQARVLKDDLIKLTQPTRKAIVAFTGGELPPDDE
jgi:hypothetical protein